MGFVAFTSASNHSRIARGREWLHQSRPADEILIVGATLGAANELAGGLAREKGASFGYHRLTLGQLTSALAQPVFAAQQTVPLGGLGVQAITNSAIHQLSEAGGLGRLQSLRAGLDSLVR